MHSTRPIAQARVALFTPQAQSASTWQVVEQAPAPLPPVLGFPPVDELPPAPPRPVLPPAPLHDTPRSIVPFSQAQQPLVNTGPPQS